MSVNNVSPASFIGGTWDSYSEGRMLAGYSASDSDFNSVNKTGGSKGSVASHTHTPATAYVDSYLDIYHAGYNEDVTEVSGFMFNKGCERTKPHTITLGGSGQSKVHRNQGTSRIDFPNTTSTGTSNGNLPPYIVCYMWKRSK